AATGIISTVVGNGVGAYGGENVPGVGSSVYYVHGLFVDAWNNLYFTEHGFGRIRRLDTVTGLVRTVAGGLNGVGYNGDGIPATSAYLNSPFDVNVRPNGDIYIADGDNNRVRRVDALTGLI